MTSTSSFSNTSAQVASFGGIVITFLGLVFNILTVFVILKSSKLKSNFIAPLIFGLAVSDITFCLQLILVSVQFYQNEAFSEDSVWCYFSPILFRCSFMSSGVFLILISVQRVILIRSLNQNTQLFTWKKTFGYFCLLWTIMILLQLLPAMNVVGKIGVKNGLPYCTIWNEGGSDFTDIDKLLFFFGYSMPFVGLIACYSLIHKSMKEVASGKERRVTKTSLIVIGSFVFVYTPGFIVYMFNKLPGENAIPELHVAMYLLGWSHAFINPIIYFFFNGFFRKEFCRVLKINDEGNSFKDTSSTNVQRRPSAYSAPFKQRENTSQTTV